MDCRDPSSPNFLRSSAKGLIPAPRNPRYTLDRNMTDQYFHEHYNNFYEFGYSKFIVQEISKFTPFFDADTWVIEIKGLVENPLKITASQLLKMFHLEERLYRHRCVEAWSKAVPWLGFPMSKLIDAVQPLSTATHVKFTTFQNTSVSASQKKDSNYPWPYTEGLTMAEAKNELTFITVGAFGVPLQPQNGAPVRLVLPWKYGFKSIKSIVSIEFVQGQPRTYWNETTKGTEYGFNANVNPEVPHARWSQAQERFWFSSNDFPKKTDTLLYNGYEQEVAYMYADYPADAKLFM